MKNQKGKTNFLDENNNNSNNDKVAMINHTSEINSENSFYHQKEKALLDANGEDINGKALPEKTHTEDIMTPFTAFSTIINIVLATGPFT